MEILRGSTYKVNMVRELAVPGEATPGCVKLICYFEVLR